MFTLDSGVVRVSTPSRAALEPSSRGVVSFDTNESVRATFEALARAAGLNIIFDSDFDGQDVRPFKVDNVDAFDALDFLAVETRTFWEVLGSNTILVAPDTEAKRLELENLLIKTFYLPDATQLELVEIVTTLRALLNCRYLSIVGTANALVIRDNPKRIAVAERIIADLRPAGTVLTSATVRSGSLAGQTLQGRAARSLMSSSTELQPTVRGPLSFDMNTGVRASFEAVAGLAGLRVVFDDKFQGGAAGEYRLQAVDILDALDFLSLQTRNIWRVIGSDTILVAPVTETVLEDFLPPVTSTIDVTGVGENGTTEIVTALRILLNLRQVAPLDNSIVITDTAENVAFAEKLVSDWTPARSR